jgi:hypothetical protein
MVIFIIFIFIIIILFYLLNFHKMNILYFFMIQIDEFML